MSAIEGDTGEPIEDIITVGTHVIVKKHGFSKVYKVSENGVLCLGKDQKVEMREIVDKPFWSTFEMVPSGSKGTFTLKLTDQVESWNDLRGELSGCDNRSITDDGTSQRLSKEEILQLQEAGKTGKEIIGSLIENSTSFAAKTEYSQEKYIKKKERKYLKFLTVHRPSILSLHEIYFKWKPEKIGRLRMDTLAQILSYSDVQSDGLHLLYCSGYQGLPAAAMLNRIGTNTNGRLINLHPGNTPQTMFVDTMNFPQELRDRHIAVNIYSFLKLCYQGESSIIHNISTSKRTIDINVEEPQDIEKPELITTQSCEKPTEESESETKNNETTMETLESETGTRENGSLLASDAEEDTKTLKRKLEFDDIPEKETVPAKKPRWLLETKQALDLLSDSKARGLTIVAKEHPLQIANALLPFLGISRPFVIFHAHREPLQETYMELKQKRNVINMKLFTNFLRSYQVLPDRTHPDISTSDTGGYILTGYLVEN
ncbi:tRNA (adenine(58)-N(1))-methyltransferase non-catalytic subunit TRM6 isoform X1 [Solenopsis invicta]|uniref:tRNA (adenine(58)-N(1))-methyltransferase non-catalytic subunit TRM6 isoform X1 n=2 Tax=Solenopsis invicta TaxID=13686 RepID=UPI0005961928|nr:tRNA (adenine(58)-N(1))-methyltransferase non-catalytic subunit TRM6 isoform X1 [Solenopsis invicta]XP_011163997.1 tRNA (adenine(58)-N(1))-methyltransferase non-catalytic subunit TRM6 isoform X1 [Solenopsis invicta]XP_039313766.1 tRNA (adenine(58)-N(1))-methyltransferase non-catalytic subunit TRM6 isoform X1 [Solenopsis invicta]